jgi:hypothetical protein
MRAAALDRQEALEMLDIAMIDVIDLIWGMLDTDRQRSLEWFEMCLRTSKLLWTFWILREFPEFANQELNGKWPIFVAIDAGPNITSIVVQVQGERIDKRATDGRRRTLSEYYDDLDDEDERDEDIITALKPLFPENDR